MGGHTHFAMFAGKMEGSLGKAGDLVLTNEEWVMFRDLLTRERKWSGATGGNCGEVVVFMKEAQNADA